MLADLAVSDPDPRVRRKALDLVEDVDAIATVAAGDADQGVREAATVALAEIAANPEADAAVAARAVAGISDERRLAAVARTSPHAQAREDALGRVHETKALGSIARSAADEGIAHAAAGRLSDAHALLDVALNGAHKDVAMSAFERIVDDQAGAADVDNRERLEQIAGKSQQKSVARRAKAILQTMADAEAARKAAEAEHRKQVTSIVESVERLAREEDWRAAEAGLTRSRGEWAAAGEIADPALASRFESATTAVRARIDAAREAEAAAAARAEEKARALAARESICARLERTDVRAESIDEARAEWDALPPAPDAADEERALGERFERAVALSVKRHEQRGAAAAAEDTLRTIAAEAASLSGNTLDEAVSRWKTLKRRWKETEQTLTDVAIDVPADALEQLKAAEEAITARETEARERKRKTAAEHVARLDRLSDRAERIVKAEAITLREGDRMLRDAKTALDQHPGEVKPEGYDAAVARLRGLLEQVGPKVRELRELDDWRRFANAQAQEELIRKAEALAAELEADAVAVRESDLGKAAATLRDLQAKWKAAAEAPRDRAQELWHRFRTPVDAVRGRCAEYFAKQAGERAGNIRKKQELCERAEALAESTDWVRTAEAFRALQGEWQAAGPVPPREARMLWDRFRKASDQFFTRRRDDLASRKTVWTDNLKKKEALCERAEALAESSDWDAAASELKRLQAEWKTIGPVRKSRSEAIWKRFRASADRFFERYHNRHQVMLEQKAADREALVAEIEAFAASEQEPENLGARVQELRAKLRVPPPLNRAEIEAQNARATAALAKMVDRWPTAFTGSDLDPEAALKRMEKLCVKAEALAEEAEPGERAAPLSQAEALAAKLRQALAANTFGGRAAEDRGPSMADQIRDLQAAWQRLLIPHTDAARAMDDRFKRAVATAREKSKARRELTKA
ncbi:MAG TPA: DUF349 domain-containing protein [Vicinamibacterales bacterium]|nr:DUF349 domain-containing protein [Vicinamibacterales bacterium]